MHIISKEFHFESSHQLNHLPDGHKCKNLHGHSYRLRVELQSDTLDSNGFVTDYRELDDIKSYVDEVLDHKFLNDIFTCHTTAENMSKELYYKFKALHPNIVAVHLSETQKTWATYRE